MIGPDATPTPTNSANQDIAGFGTRIDAGGFELVTFTGQDAADTLSVQLGAGDNTARVERGSSADLVTSDSLPAVEFSGQCLGRAISAMRLLLQAFQTDRFQIQIDTRVA